VDSCTIMTDVINYQVHAFDIVCLTSESVLGVLKTPTPV